MKTTCPICKQPMQVERMTDWPSFPFCSAKCRTIDLGRWLGQEYRLAAADGGEELDEATSVPHESAEE